MAILPTDPSRYNLDSVTLLIKNATEILILMAGTTAAIFIVIGAFNYLTAFGSEEKAEEGKKTLTWAIIGLVLVIVSQLLVGTLLNFLTGK